MKNVLRILACALVLVTVFSVVSCAVTTDKVTAVLTEWQKKGKIDSFTGVEINGDGMYVTYTSSGKKVKTKEYDPENKKHKDEIEELDAAMETGIAMLETMFNIEIKGNIITNYVAVDGEDTLVIMEFENISDAKQIEELAKDAGDESVVREGSIIITSTNKKLLNKFLEALGA